MVAISTDTPRWHGHDPYPRTSSAPTGHLRLAAGGGRAEPAPTGPGVLVAVAVVLLVVAVAVGTVAFGRMLDSQRGITAAPTGIEASVGSDSTAGR